MVFHLFPYSIFAEDYIKKVNEIFKQKDHLFWVYGSDENKQKQKISSFQRYANVYLDQKYSENFKLYMELIKNIMKADKIIIHSMNMKEDILFIVSMASIICGRKMVWASWGRDFGYECKRYKKESIKTVRMIIRENLRRILLYNAGGIIATKKGYKEGILCYKVRGGRLDAKYPYQLEFSDLQLEYCKNKNFIGILVGHRGTSTSRHMEVFRYLSQFNNKDIKIFCPLSYGEPDYILKVMNTGKNMFHDKFVPILRFMETKEYMEYLHSNIDIAIFNNVASEGGGNILRLAYLGKKIYISPMNPLLSEYGNDLFLKQFSIELQETEFFKLLSDKERLKNKISVKKMCSNEVFQSKWKRVFSVNMKIHRKGYRI